MFHRAFNSCLVDVTAREVTYLFLYQSGFEFAHLVQKGVSAPYIYVQNCAIAAGAVPIAFVTFNTTEVSRSYVCYVVPCPCPRLFLFYSTNTH